MFFFLVCPANTVTVGDKCFRYVETVRTWEDAKIDCVEQGGYLAMPDFDYYNFAVEMASIYRNIMGNKSLILTMHLFVSYATSSPFHFYLVLKPFKFLDRKETYLDRCFRFQFYH